MLDALQLLDIAVQVPARKPVVGVYVVEQECEHAVVAFLVAELAQDVLGLFARFQVPAVERFADERVGPELVGIQPRDKVLREHRLQGVELCGTALGHLRGELRERVHLLDVRDSPAFLEPHEVAVEFLARCFIRHLDDDGVVLGEPGLRDQGICSGRGFLNFGLLEIVEELEVLAAVDKADETYDGYNRDEYDVQLLREQLNLEFAVEAELAHGEGLVLLEQ